MSEARYRPGNPAWKTPVLLAAGAALGLVGGLVLAGGQHMSASPAARYAAGKDQNAAERPAVTLTHPKIRAIEQTLTTVGTGRALQSLTLTSNVSGIVEKILVKSSQLVKEGAPLIVLQKEQQEIAVAKARADYNIAKTNAARFEGLLEDKAASALENESAQNELSAATAQLHQAEYDLSQRTIRAPFDGVIGLMTLALGDYLTAGSKIMTIDDVSSLLVDFVIPEGASAYVKKGLAVTAVAASSNGRQVKGRVRAVDSRIDPATRTRHVEAILNNDDHALVPGSTITISLVAPGREAIETPGLAVQWDRAGAYVWKVGPKGEAVRVSVVILQRNSDSVLLDAALSPADLVIAEGADSVRAGMVVADQGAGGPTPSGASAAFE